MKKLFGLFLLALAFLVPNLANAATCFWVGGTGTWDNATNILSWASGTGGTPGTCAATGSIPKQATDIATFDANSGGGVVTVDSTMSGVTMAQITAGAFTGTLDFSANNPSMTLTTAMSLTGTGARKFLLGTGTFTLTGTATVYDLGTVTNLDGTSNFAANFTLSATTTGTRTFAGGGRTYGALTVSINTSRGFVVLSGANTFSSISLAAGTSFVFPVSATTTITNAFTWMGTSTNPINLQASNVSSGSVPVISVGSGTSTCDWCSIYEIAPAGGGTFNATNSFDQGRNSGWTFTPPSGGGGGGRIIGG